MVIEKLAIGTEVRVTTRDHGMNQFGLTGRITSYRDDEGDYIYKVHFDEGQGDYAADSMWNSYRHSDIDDVTGPW